LQPLVGDGLAAADRATKVAVVNPLKDPVNCRQPVPESGRHGVIDTLLGQ
jgi:hypothetical protein